MHRVAEDVWRIPLTPRNGVNAYLLGDVLVDAGTPQLAGRALSAVRGRSVSAHAITHAHADHVGGSKRVTATLGVPLWAPADDAEAVESGRPAVPASGVVSALAKLGRWPGRPVDRRLRDGDELAAGFVAVLCPGHSPGHTAYWRESDRLLVAGDVFFNLHPLTLRPGAVRPRPAAPRRGAGPARLRRRAGLADH